MNFKFCLSTSESPSDSFFGLNSYPHDIKVYLLIHANCQQHSLYIFFIYRPRYS